MDTFRPKMHRLQRMMQDREPEAKKANKLFEKYSPLTEHLGPGSLREARLRKLAERDIQEHMRRLEVGWNRRHPKAIAVTSRDMLKATGRVVPVVRFGDEQVEEVEMAIEEHGDGEGAAATGVVKAEEAEERKEEEKEEKEEKEEGTQEKEAMETSQIESIAELEEKPKEEKTKPQTRFYHTTRLAAWRATRYKQHSQASEPGLWGAKGEEKIQGLPYTEFLNRLALMRSRGDQGQLEADPQPIQRIGGVPLVATFKNKPLKIPERSPLYEIKRSPSELEEDEKKKKKKMMKPKKEKDVASTSSKGKKKRPQMLGSTSDESLLTTLTTVCSGCSLAARMRAPVLSRVDSNILRVTRKTGVWKRCRDCACQTDPILTPTYVPTPSASDTGQGWLFLSDISISSSSGRASTADTELRPYTQDALITPDLAIPPGVTLEEAPRVEDVCTACGAYRKATSPQYEDRSEYTESLYAQSRETESPWREGQPSELSSYTTKDSYDEKVLESESFDKQQATSEYSYSTQASTEERVAEEDYQQTDKDVSLASSVRTVHSLSLESQHAWFQACADENAEMEGVMAVPLRTATDAKREREEVEEKEQKAEQPEAAGKTEKPSVDTVHSMPLDSQEAWFQMCADENAEMEGIMAVPLRTAKDTKKHSMDMEEKGQKAEQPQAEAVRGVCVEVNVEVYVDTVHLMSPESQHAWFQACADEYPEMEGVLAVPLRTAADSKREGEEAEGKEQKTEQTKAAEKTDTVHSMPLDSQEAWFQMCADENAEMEGIMAVPLRTAKDTKKLSIDMEETGQKTEQPKMEAGRETEELSVDTVHSMPLESQQAWFQMCADENAEMEGIMAVPLRTAKDTKKLSIDMEETGQKTEQPKMEAGRETEELSVDTVHSMPLESQQAWFQMCADENAEMEGIMAVRLQTSKDTKKHSIEREEKAHTAKEVHTAEAEPLKESREEAERGTPEEAERGTPEEAERGTPKEAEKGTPEEAEASTQESQEEPTEEIEEAPKTEAEEAPTTETKKAPIAEAVEAPTEEPQDAPAGETNEAPTEAAEEAIAGEPKVAPAAEVEEAPTEEAPTPEAEQAPTEEAEEAPTEDGKDALTFEETPAVEEAPTEKSEKAATEEAEEAPTEKAEEAPTADAGEVPAGEVEEAPAEEAEEAPTADAGEIPAGKVQEAPTKEAEEVLTADAGEAPAGEAEKAPTVEPEEAPTTDVGEAPAGEAEEAPTEKAGETPTADAGEAPAGEAEKVPTEEAEEAPTADAREAPAGEAEEAPIEETLTAHAGEAPAAEADEALTQAPTEEPEEAATEEAEKARTQKAEDASAKEAEEALTSEEAPAAKAEKAFTEEAPTSQEAPAAETEEARTEEPEQAAIEEAKKAPAEEAEEAPTADTEEAPAAEAEEAVTQEVEASQESEEEAPAVEAEKEPTEEPEEAATEEAKEAPSVYAVEAPSVEAEEVPTEGAEETPTEEAMKAPTEETMEAPAEEAKEAPPTEAEQAPTEETMEALAEEAKEEPPAEAEGAPTEETMEAPAEEAKEAPPTEAEEAPPEETMEAPAEEDKEALPTEAEEAPTEETMEIPAEEDKEAPPTEAEQAPTEEAMEAPAEEAKEAPPTEAEKAPTEETMETHAEEAEEAPPTEAEEAPTEETMEIPAEEAKEAPPTETEEAPTEDTMEAPAEEDKEAPRTEAEEAPAESLEPSAEEAEGAPPGKAEEAPTEEAREAAAEEAPPAEAEEVATEGAEAHTQEADEGSVAEAEKASTEETEEAPTEQTEESATGEAEKVPTQKAEEAPAEEPAVKAEEAPITEAEEAPTQKITDQLPTEEDMETPTVHKVHPEAEEAQELATAKQYPAEPVETETPADSETLVEDKVLVDSEESKVKFTLRRQSQEEVQEVESSLKLKDSTTSSAAQSTSKCSFVIPAEVGLEAGFCSVESYAKLKDPSLTLSDGPDETVFTVTEMELSVGTTLSTDQHTDEIPVDEKEYVVIVPPEKLYSFVVADSIIDVALHEQPEIVSMVSQAVAEANVPPSTLEDEVEAEWSPSAESVCMGHSDIYLSAGRVASEQGVVKKTPEKQMVSPAEKGRVDLSAQVEPEATPKQTFETPDKEDAADNLTMTAMNDRSEETLSEARLQQRHSDQVLDVQSSGFDITNPEACKLPVDDEGREDAVDDMTMAAENDQCAEVLSDGCLQQRDSDQVLHTLSKGVDSTTPETGKLPIDYEGIEDADDDALSDGRLQQKDSDQVLDTTSIGVDGTIPDTSTLPMDDEGREGDSATLTMAAKDDQFRATLSQTSFLRQKYSDNIFESSGAESSPETSTMRIDDVCFADDEDTDADDSRGGRAKVKIRTVKRNSSYHPRLIVDSKDPDESSTSIHPQKFDTPLKPLKMSVSTDDNQPSEPSETKKDASKDMLSKEADVGQMEDERTQLAGEDTDVSSGPAVVTGIFGTSVDGEESKTAAPLDETKQEAEVPLSGEIETVALPVSEPEEGGVTEASEKAKAPEVLAWDGGVVTPSPVETTSEGTEEVAVPDSKSEEMSVPVSNRQEDVITPASEGQATVPAKEVVTLKSSEAGVAASASDEGKLRKCEDDEELPVSESIQEVASLASLAQSAVPLGDKIEDDADAPAEEVAISTSEVHKEDDVDVPAEEGISTSEVREDVDVPAEEVAMSTGEVHKDEDDVDVPAEEVEISTSKVREGGDNVDVPAEEVTMSISEVRRDEDGVDVPAEEVEMSISEARKDEDGVDTAAEEVAMSTSEVRKDEDGGDVPAEEVEISTSKVREDGDDVDVPAEEVAMSTSEVLKDEDGVDVPAEQVAMSTSEVRKDEDDVDVPAEEVEISASKVLEDRDDVGVPVEEVATSISEVLKDEDGVDVPTEEVAMSISEVRNDDDVNVPAEQVAMSTSEVRKDEDDDVPSQEVAISTNEKEVRASAGEIVTVIAEVAKARVEDAQEKESEVDDRKTVPDFKLSEDRATESHGDTAGSSSDTQAGSPRKKADKYRKVSCCICDVSMRESTGVLSAGVYTCNTCAEGVKGSLSARELPPERRVSLGPAGARPSSVGEDGKLKDQSALLFFMYDV